jgi:hypothetical protein
MPLDSDRFLGRTLLLFSPTCAIFLSLSSPLRMSVMCLIITSIATKKEGKAMGIRDRSLFMAGVALKRNVFFVHVFHVTLSAYPHRAG